MPGCCRRDYERFFTRSLAARWAARYRKRGLDKTSRRMVDFLRDRGIDGSTIVEIGGGVGEIQIELLRAGASHVTGLELPATWEDDAGSTTSPRNQRPSSRQTSSSCTASSAVTATIADFSRPPPIMHDRCSSSAIRHTTSASAPS